MRNSSQIHCAKSANATDHAVNGRDRPTLHHFNQRTQLRCAQQRARAWSMPVDQAICSVRVEAHHPISHDLQADTADPGRVTA